MLYGLEPIGQLCQGSEQVLLELLLRHHRRLLGALLLGVVARCCTCRCRVWVLYEGDLAVWRLRLAFSVVDSCSQPRGCVVVSSLSRAASDIRHTVKVKSNDAVRSALDVFTYSYLCQSNRVRRY